jgi:hypothetical protein
MCSGAGDDAQVHTSVFLALLVTAATIACVTISKTVELTPEALPEEVRNAHWQDLPLSYCIVTEAAGFVPNEELASGVAAAFESWGVEARNRGACASVENGDGVNQIGWGDLSQESALHEAGNTMLRYRTCRLICPGGEGARIVEADIVIDREPPATLRSARCLYTTLLHETGHLLGLQHLEAPAIMAPALAGCPQEPTQRDRQALEGLYGGS